MFQNSANNCVSNTVVTDVLHTSTLGEVSEAESTTAATPSGTSAVNIVMNGPIPGVYVDEPEPPLHRHPELIDMFLRYLQERDQRRTEAGNDNNNTGATSTPATGNNRRDDSDTHYSIALPKSETYIITRGRLTAFNDYLYPASADSPAVLIVSKNFEAMIDQATDYAHRGRFLDD